MNSRGAAPAASKRPDGVPATISHDAPLPAWMAFHPGYQHELNLAVRDGDTDCVQRMTALFARTEYGGRPISKEVDVGWLFAQWMLTWRQWEGGKK